MLGRLAIVIFPFAAIITCSSAPIVMLGPFLRIVEPFGITRKGISLHVAGMVGGIVPERVMFGGMCSLPVIVHFLDNLTYLLSLVGCSGNLCSGKQERGGCE